MAIDYETFRALVIKVNTPLGDFTRINTYAMNQLYAELETYEAARAPVRETSDLEWRELFWKVAEELKCWPSSFLDGNDHVIKAARDAMASKAKEGT